MVQRLVRRWLPHRGQWRTRWWAVLQIQRSVHGVRTQPARDAWRSSLTYWADPKCRESSALYTYIIVLHTRARWLIACCVHCADWWLAHRSLERERDRGRLPEHNRGGADRVPSGRAPVLWNGLPVRQHVYRWLDLVSGRCVPGYPLLTAPTNCR